MIRTATVLVLPLAVLACCLCGARSQLWTEDTPNAAACADSWCYKAFGVSIVQCSGIRGDTQWVKQRR